MEGVGGGRGGSVWGGEAKSSQTLKWSSRQRRCWVKQSLLTRVRMDGHVCENIFRQGTAQSYPTSNVNTLLKNHKMNMNMFLKHDAMFYICRFIINAKLIVLAPYLWCLFFSATSKTSHKYLPVPNLSEQLANKYSTNIHLSQGASRDVSTRGSVSPYFAAVATLETYEDDGDQEDYDYLGNDEEDDGISLLSYIV